MVVAIDESLKSWKRATGRLSWGVQQVFKDALILVAEEKVTLVYGADYRNGNPCLVNSVAQMLKVGGGQGVPSLNFGEVVGLFDTINHFLREKGINDESGNVSPLAAEILLANFADSDPVPPVEVATNEAMKNEAFANNVYVEPSDEDMAREWLNALQSEAPVECEDNSQIHPFSE